MLGARARHSNVKCHLFYNLVGEVSPIIMWINKEYYRKPMEGNGGVGEGFRINVEFELGFRDVI